MTLTLAPAPPAIGDTDGFDVSDIFHAKRAGERLANIVRDLAGHAVVLLDGPWGSGKSVFARQWAGLLRQRGHTVVEFDAFAHDHLDDAFFPLFGHLLAASDSGHPRQKHSKASLIEAASPLLRAMPRIAADAALRVGTSGIMSLAHVLQHTHAAEPTADDGITTLIKDSIS